MCDSISDQCHIRCHACFSDIDEELIREGAFLAKKCVSCGLVQTHPVPEPDELRDYYRAFGFLPPNSATIIQHLKAIRQSLSHHLGESGDNKAFLDYSGGYIIASPVKRFHDLSRQLISQPWKAEAAWALAKLGWEQLAFRMLSLVAPHGGEQLYMVFTKKP